MAITIDGGKYKVAENLGFNHSVGAYAKLVETEAGNRMAVKFFGVWRFWTAADRVAPLRKAPSRKGGKTVRTFSDLYYGNAAPDKIRKLCELYRRSLKAVVAKPDDTSDETSDV